MACKLNSVAYANSRENSLEQTSENNRFHLQTCFYFLYRNFYSHFYYHHVYFCDHMSCLANFWMRYLIFKP